MGLASASTGVLFPFFSPLLGWLGVALTGSDTSSNVLFGGLQRIGAERLGLSPILACAANSSGVMGKMIDAQSTVVAGVATGQQGNEGEKILRYVFWHSIARLPGRRPRSPAGVCLPVDDPGAAAAISAQVLPPRTTGRRAAGSGALYGRACGRSGSQNRG